MEVPRFVLTASLSFFTLGGAIVTAEEPEPPQPSTPSVACAGSLAVQLDAKGNTIVVTDASRQTLAVYYADGSQVRLIGVRHLDRDFTGEAAKEPSPASLPTKDAPGQDPPDFRRPPNSVRALSEYRAEFGGEEYWNAIYVAQGTVADVFSSLKSGFKDWKLLIENGGVKRGSQLTVAKSKTQLEMLVDAVETSPGWVQVRVTEHRPRAEKS